MTRDDIIARITEVAQQHGIDPYIGVRQCQKESSFNPAATNAASGALGLFQFEPATAAEWHFNPLDPDAAIQGWGAYMGWLLPQVGGDVAKALAAYDWGIGHVKRLLASMGPDDDWREHLPAETQQYIAVICA